MKAKTIWRLLKETFAAWQADKASRLAAALAYYTAFSLAPVLVIVIAIAGFAFGQQAVQGQLVEQIQGLVGQEAAEVIQGMLQSAQEPRSGLIATITSLVLLLFGASGMFGQLQDALNTVWHVQPDPRRGVTGLIKDRAVSFTVVLGTGFLLLVSLALSAALSAVGHFFGSWLIGWVYLGQILNLLVSFSVITFLFAMIYKFLPDVKIAWGDVWAGAAMTAALFTLGKFLIGLYLGNSSVGSAYGAAGSFVVILLWVYYSAQILLFGAEFTQVYAHWRGSRIEPADYAIPLQPTEADTVPDDVTQGSYTERLERSMTQIRRRQRPRNPILSWFRHLMRRSPDRLDRHP